MFRLTKQDKINEADQSNISLDSNVASESVDEEQSIGQDQIHAATSTFLQLFVNIDSRLQEQNKLLSDVIDSRNDDLVAIQTCFNTAADCQKQTSDLVNQCLERHALYPAIFAVETLVDIINETANQAKNLLNGEQLDESRLSFVNWAMDAAKIAHSKSEQLGIQKICPAESDGLDGNQHTIVNTVLTDDESRHKKIQKTLVAGLFYNGKVLRQAKVSVYRFSGN